MSAPAYASPRLGASLVVLAASDGPVEARTPAYLRPGRVMQASG